MTKAEIRDIRDRLGLLLDLAAVAIGHAKKEHGKCSDCGGEGVVAVMEHTKLLVCRECFIKRKRALKAAN